MQVGHVRAQACQVSVMPDKVLQLSQLVAINILIPLLDRIFPLMDLITYSLLVAAPVVIKHCSHPPLHDVYANRKFGGVLRAAPTLNILYIFYIEHIEDNILFII